MNNTNTNTNTTRSLSLLLQDQQQQALKRMRRALVVVPTNQRLKTFFPGFDDDDLLSKVVPPVTVVYEGRSICHRISLHKHASYSSLAKALRQMFVVDGGGDDTSADNELDLSNAVPGHLVAYEDIEDDLLLAGDLNWKDFVRVAKRIRILPVKTKSKKGQGGAMA